MAVGLVEQPSSIRAIFSSPDSVGLALADVAAVAVLGGATLIAGTDAVGITIAEAAATILGLIATTDDISVQPTESGALAVTLQAVEAVTIVVADADALIAALGIAAGDVAALALDEAAAAVTIDLDPGPAGVPSWSAGFRRG